MLGQYGKESSAYYSPFPVASLIGGWVAVYHIYADESGKLANNDYTSLCGYVGHTYHWEEFSRRWKGCCLKYGVPPIHMSRITKPDQRDDAWKAVKEKWGPLWPRISKRLLGELRDIISTSDIACIGSVVDSQAYREIKKTPGHRLVQRDPNVFAFHHIIMRGLERIELVDKQSPVSIVIDHDPEQAKEYFRLFDTLRTHPDPRFARVRERIGGLAFCDDTMYPGLQAADMISYEARTFMEKKIKKPNLQPGGAYALMTYGGINQPKLYTREALEEISRRTFEKHGTPDEWSD